MADDQDQAQKTEEPTRKRIEDARKKGQLPTSREINSLFMLLTFGFIMLVLLPHIMIDLKVVMFPLIARPEDLSADYGNLMIMMKETVRSIGAIMAVPIGLAVIAALSAGLMQTRLNFSIEPIKPKLEKISPLKGLKRMFSMRSVMEFLKGILKITIVGIVAVLAIIPDLEYLPVLPDKDIYDILGFLALLTKRMLIGVLVVFFFIAVADYAYQRYEYMKNLRMTKQEVKDEFKQQEGDPHVKMKLRQIRMERAKQRMMAAVPDADVVITNPTHYAVAMKYDPATMPAPMVVAKGKDKVAERIKEVAREHRILIMRNPALTRAIYATVDLDTPINAEHYEAVAKIISYVYQLQGKSLAAEDSSNLVVPTVTRK